MSLQFAMAVHHMGVSGLEFPALGLNKFGAFDTAFGSAPPETVTQKGKMASLNRGTSGQHGWTMLPNFIVPTAVKKIYFGCRFTGLVKHLGDVNTAPLYLNIGGGKLYLFQSVANSAQVPPTDCYLEVEIDRDQGTVTGYIDGVSVGVIANISGGTSANLTTAGFTLGIAARNYNDARALFTSDAYIAWNDGVYPSARLGPVKISSVPVKVSSVSGFDKTAAELETIVNTRIVNTQGQPLTKGTVAKANAAAAEVNFSLDLTGIDVSRQLAAGIFVGAQRTGSQTVTATLERKLDAVTTTDQAVDLTTRSADRLNFIAPLAARTASTTRSLNDITHKLKFVEA
jgi:hypothetical protein